MATANGKELIDRLRSKDGSLTQEAIRKILPYGDGFLFVHGVLRLTEREILAEYRIPAKADYLRAHFDGFPLMPGVLIGEGLAQAGALMIRYNLEQPVTTDLLAYQIESAQFPAPALPGETLTFKVELKNLSRRAARLEGEASVGERTVCKMRAVLAIMPRSKMEEHVAKLRRDSDADCA